MSHNHDTIPFSKTHNMPAFYLSGDALANAYYNYEKLQTISNWLADKVREKPLIGIVCGSGLGSIGERVEERIIIPYEDIPDFPRSTVEGHRGNLIFGKINNVPVVCMQGRFHPYEGYVMAICTLPIKIFKLLGVKLMILTNAAGALNETYNVGDLMLIKDHITFPVFSLSHPLIGTNDQRFGPRFLPVNNLYTKEMRDLAKEVSQEIGVNLREGVYSAIGGPTYETVSDAIFLRNSGADVVGMSTAHEAIVAAYCGLKVLALSIATDKVAFEFDAPVVSDHEEICKIAKEKTKDVEQLVLKFIKRIDQNRSLLD